MTDKQPEALRIASEVSASAILLEHLPSNPGFNGAVLLIDDTEAERVATGCAAAAAELRRQHALIAELVDALRLIAGTDPVDAALDPQRAVRIARAALSKAEAQQ
jgi:hypothetical protein